MKEITTKEYRCDSASPMCPGVIRFDDGTYGYRNLEIWPTGIKGPSERVVTVSEKDVEMIAAAIAADKER